MAIEKSAHGQIQELGRVLARRRWQILLPALYVFVLAGACAVLVPKKRVYQTRIEIQERRNPEDYELKDPQEAAPVRELTNIDQHIRHYNRVQGIVESSKLWPGFGLLAPQEQQQRIAAILDDIDVDLLEKAKNQGSTFVDILYRDVDPARAEAFLVLLADTWIEALREEDLATLKRELQTLREAEKESWSKRQEAFSKYADLAREMGLNPADPPDVRSQTAEPVRDFQFDQRDHLRREREATQRSLERSRFELSLLEKRHAEEPSSIPRPPIERAERNRAEIERLQDEIEGLRADLERLTPKNRNYARLQGEIAERELELEELLEPEAAVASPVSDPNPFKEDLRKRRDEKAAEVASLEKSEKLLAQDVRDYENKIEQRTEDYARLMLFWSTSEELTRQHELAWSKVVEKAGALQQMEAIYGHRPYESVSPPRELGVEPNAIALTAFGLLAGLALGLVTALFLEYGRNAYRSVGDLTAVMALPVLGSVGRIVTRAEARRARLRRGVVGLSSVAILGSVVWITGVWMLAPHLLPVDLERAIEGLRSLWT